MRKERAVKKKAQQEARVFYRMKMPRPICREITYADYTLLEISAMCAEGWKITFCQLQRSVEVDAIEVTLTGDDIPPAVDPEAPAATDASASIN